MNASTHPALFWLAVALIVTVTTSRLIRLWTYDDFPPTAWVRGKFLDFTDKHTPSWSELGFCPWCVGFWIALAVIGTGYAADIYPWLGWASVWWTIAGALSSSYLAAMLMARDGDKSRDKPEPDPCPQVEIHTTKPPSRLDSTGSAF